MRRGQRLRAVPDVASATRLRSEGQRMLLHVTGSLVAIAAEISPNTSKQSILDWRNGVRMPSAPARLRMSEVFGIPFEAWSKRPRLGDEDPSAPPDAPPPPPPVVEVNGTSLDDCMALLALIKRDRSAIDILPSERVKLIDAEARILKLRAELEARLELSEDRYVREHPAWSRVRNAIADALKPHPAAAQAVADALDRLGA